MELVSPAGNIEKLQYVYSYGADAAYIGLKKFSLRAKADNFYADEYAEIKQLKARYPNKRLFCALNISFHNKDISQFISDIDYFKKYPFDAFIIQDPGMIHIIRTHFPNASLHLSTQANCINKEAVKVYQSLGFNRIVLGREASLAEIREIKDAVPDMELEVFCHGAMCISYSGRCLMSAYLTARSANSGFCSHSCRWNYRLALEEQQRQGEYFPVFEGDGFTALLSSKDICMIDHLDDMKKAGIDALKIEGRMKSLYYAALTTRAYRKALDLLEGKITAEQAAPFTAELYNAAHREFSTGFYYNKEDADKTTSGESDGEYEFAGTIGAQLSEAEENAVFAAAQKAEQAIQKETQAMHPAARSALEQDFAANPHKRPRFAAKKQGYHFFEYIPMNKITAGTELEYISPDIISMPDSTYQLVHPETARIADWICHGHACLLYTEKPAEENWIVRFRTANTPAGSILSKC
ncbi:MAG: U32 family peptidase [Bacteroides sp.]|nr:U32 family peptidase [Prevotella sp.]MCM1407639.1 U32 family peptidase [Treponema brennaborense]MCM1469211.1 U32 family peptidase [Bacteroides sp.]